MPELTGANRILGPLELEFWKDFWTHDILLIKGYIILFKILFGNNIYQI